MNEIQIALENLCRRHGITSLYVFGSRAGEIAARARGEDATSTNPDSDGDFAAQFGEGRRARGLALGRVISDLEDIFDLPRADLLVLNEADPFMALEAVRGELIYCLDLDAQAEEELRILRVAGDLLALPDLSSQVETDALLSIPGMRESLAEAEADVAAGRTLSVQQALQATKLKIKN